MDFEDKIKQEPLKKLNFLVFATINWRSIFTKNEEMHIIDKSTDQSNPDIDYSHNCFNKFLISFWVIVHKQLCLEAKKYISLECVVASLGNLFVVRVRYHQWFGTKSNFKHKDNR